jgi:drug/metabolite transporter (DMT)-like permease
MLILFLRVILGPFTNVYQKKLSNKGANAVFVVFVTYLVFGLILLPFTFIINYQTIGKGFWQSVVVASVLDGVGNIFLVKALETTELSVFGPINSFKPAIAMLISAVLINEIPSAYGITGLIVILTGSILFTYEKQAKIKISKGIVYRILGILFSALAAVYIKKSINYSTPEITLIFWTLIVIPTMSIVLLFDLNKTKSNILIMLNNTNYYLLLIILYSFMQYITLLCFKYTLVGYSLAIFQLSSIVSVLLGYRYFNEKGMKKKLICSVIMIIGAILILIK